MAFAGRGDRATNGCRAAVGSRNRSRFHRAAGEGHPRAVGREGDPVQQAGPVDLALDQDFPGANVPDAGMVAVRDQPLAVGRRATPPTPVPRRNRPLPNRATAPGGSRLPWESLCGSRRSGEASRARRRRGRACQGVARSRRLAWRGGSRRSRPPSRFAVPTRTEQTWTASPGCRPPISPHGRCGRNPEPGGQQSSSVPPIGLRHSRPGAIASLRHRGHGVRAYLSRQQRSSGGLRPVRKWMRRVRGSKRPGEQGAAPDGYA